MTLSSVSLLSFLFCWRFTFFCHLCSFLLFVSVLVSCVGFFRRWFTPPLWICSGSSTSCKKPSRRPLALLALDKENFAEVGERILTCSLLPLQTKHDSLWRILRRSTRLLTKQFRLPFANSCHPFHGFLASWSPKTNLSLLDTIRSF